MFIFLYILTWIKLCHPAFLGCHFLCSPEGTNCILVELGYHGLGYTLGANYIVNQIVLPCISVSEVGLHYIKYSRCILCGDIFLIFLGGSCVSFLFQYRRALISKCFGTNIYQLHIYRLIDRINYHISSTAISIFFSLLNIFNI